MRTVLILAAAGILLASQPAASAEDGVEGVTAVASKVSADYVRAKLSDGSFAPEAYAFGEGGFWGGGMRDATIDGLKFIDVAHVIAGPLAERSYLPGKDPGKTKLLIMVYWGLTAAPNAGFGSSASDNLSTVQSILSDVQSATAVKDASSPLTQVASGFHGLNSGSSAAMSGARDDQVAAYSQYLMMVHLSNIPRDQTNFFNAAMLGYDATGLIGTEKGNYARGTAFGVQQADLVADIEENRYFVVLMAYDFQILWKQKKHKLLWETRFSVSERHNGFDKALPVMTRYASKYFGEASNGLVRDRVPEGKVKVGAPTLIEFISEPKK
jgi:hypothetical protein